jgi:anti-anti-sigma factor
MGVALMKLNTKDEKGVLIAAIEGRLDAVSAPEFTERMSQLIDAGSDKIIVNFAELNYISSAGLRSILATAKKLKAKDGTILLTTLQGTVKEVFEISGFESIFQIFNSVEDALAELK